MQNLDDRIVSYEPFFGEWRLDDPPKVLGRGNSGTVYLVHSGNVDAALKVIPIPKDDKQLQEMLEKNGGSMERVREQLDKELKYAKTEIEIMSRLTSDSHIVCFERYDIKDREDTYGWDVIIRMERLVRLDDFLKNPEKYGIHRGERMVARIWSELVSGLCLCERSGVVHLDIKPDNIFYAEPSRDYFKLGDFGVSIRSDNGKGVSEGMVVGTWEYMAPEVYSGKGGDIRSDMYSLAIVMYELFNKGRLPFMDGISKPTENDYKAAWMRRLKDHQKIPPIKGLNPNLSEILMRCLRTNPEDRYPSMQALSIELQRYLIGSDQNPSHDGKPKWWIPVAAGVVAAAVMTVAGIVIFSNHDNPDEVPGVAPTAHFQSNFSKAHGKVNGETDITYSGETMPGDIVSLYLNDEAMPYAQSAADEHGQWQITLDKSLFLDGMMYKVDIRVGDVSYFIDAFSYDTSVLLVPDSNVVVSGGKIHGISESSAVITLFVDGRETARTTAGTDGMFDLDLVEDLISDDSDVSISTDSEYLLEAVDSVGNRRTVSMTAEISDTTVLIYKPIEIASIQGIEVRDDTYIINSNSGGLNYLSLSCEPDTAIQMDFEDKSIPPRMFPVREDGSVDIDLDMRDGVYQIRISYYGRSEYNPVNIRLIVDRETPVVEDFELPVAMDETALEIHTEPGARLEIQNSAGEAVIRGDADGDGICLFKPYVYQYGQYTIVVRDTAGNETREDFNTELRFRVDAVNTASDGVHIHTVPGARVEVEGDVTSSGEADAQGEYVALFDAPCEVGDTYAVMITVDGKTLSESVVAERLKLEQKIIIDVAPLVDDNTISGNMEVSGTAQPGARLTVLWNDAVVGETQADEAGNYAITLDPVASGLPASGDVGAITVRYTEGIEGEPVGETGALLWDGYAELSIDPLTQDSDMLSGRTDPNASLTITLNGNRADQIRADDKGAFEWYPRGGSFELNDTYAIAVEDESGNTASAEQVVQRAVRAPITLTDTVQRDMDLVVTGTAQAGKRVRVTWNDAYSEETLVENSGEFRVTFDAEACDVPYTGVTGELFIEYADGIGEEYAYISGRITWDAFAHLSVDAVSEDDADVIINTDPGAVVSITRDDNVIFEGRSDAETGELVWKGKIGDHIMGDVYSIVATDVAGNRAEASVTVEGTSLAGIDAVLQSEDASAWGRYDGENYCNSSRIVLLGTAEPGTRLELIINGEVADIPCAVDADGRFETQLDASALKISWAGRECVIGLAYADGRGASLRTELEGFMWDWSTYLTVEELHEDDRAIAFTTELGNTYSIEQAGAVLYEGSAEREVVSLEPETEFVEGTVYTVRVADAFGNEASADITVEEAQRAPITFEVMDAEDGIVSSKTLMVAGSAQPDSEVEVFFGDAENSVVVRTSDDGSFEAALDFDKYDIPARGRQAELTVRYWDGKGQKLTNAQIVTWDAEAAVALSAPLREDSGGMDILTDPMAKVVVSPIDGGAAESYEGSADSDGLCHFDMSADSLHKGMTYQITVEDPLGHMAQMRCIVEETTRAHITANLPEAGDAYYVNDAITIEGQAQPNTRVSISDSTHVWDDIPVDSEGAFSLTIKGAECEIPAEGADVVFQAYYTDGVGRVSKTRLTELSILRWDYIAPVLTLDNDFLDTRTSSISGHTDGIRVQVYINGEAASPVAVNEEGSFVTTERMTLKEGDAVRITSADEAGNTTETTMEVFGAAAWQIGAIRLESDTYKSTDSMLIGGWYACHGREYDNVYLALEKDGTAVSGVNIVLSTIEMDAQSLNTYASGWSELAEVNQGATFTASLPLAGLDGEYALLLKTFDPEEGTIVIAESTFSVQAVQKVVEQSEVVSDYAVMLESETPYAVGFDIPQGTFNDNEVMLTGWFYGSEEARDYRIDGVMIYDRYEESVAGGRSGIRLDEVEYAAMPVQGVCYLERDTGKLPAEMRQKLSIVPFDGRAGFVIYIDSLNLPDGEYTVVLKTAVDGAPETAGSIPITVENGSAQPVTHDTIAVAVDGWPPIHVEEAEAFEESTP